MTGGPVRTVFLGSGEFGRDALRVLARHPDISLVGVVTAPARPAGRHRVPTATPIAAAASELGVTPILTPERLRAPEAIDAVLGLDPDLAALADYGQIVPPPLLGLRHGALNLHPSLLPRHRGASPVPAAILAGDTETGVTLMRMDAGLDTGPIIAQDRMPIADAIAAPELEAILAAAAAALLERSLGPWLRGELASHEQPSEGATLTRPLRREEGRLDPRRPADHLARQVRAFRPWPGSFVETVAGRLVIWSASAESATGGGETAPPGTIDTVGLMTAAGTRLRFDEVQPGGGRRMSWPDYLRGHPEVVGSVVRTPGVGGAD